MWEEIAARRSRQNPSNTSHYQEIEGTELSNVSGNAMASRARSTTGNSYADSPVIPNSTPASPPLGTYSNFGGAPLSSTTSYPNTDNLDSPEVVQHDCYPEVVDPNSRYTNQPQAIYPPPVPPLPPNYAASSPTEPIKDDRIYEHHHDHHPAMSRSGTSVVDARSEKAPPSKKKNLWLYVIIGILILLVILAGVLGGVLGSHAVNEAKEQCAVDAAAVSSGAPSASPSPSSTPSATTNEPSSPTSSPSPNETFTVPDRGFVQLDCPALSDETIDVGLGPVTYPFEMTCGGAFSRGANSDLLTLISYSYYHCLQACASMNQYSGHNVCKGVEFNSDLSTAFEFAGNCFLSNSTRIVTEVGADDDEANRRVTGVLGTPIDSREE